MKTSSYIFIAFTAIIFYSTGLKAQDTLILKSGQKVASKILEVSPTEIKYKKADNPEGPTYIANSADINIVKYQNGTSDTIKVTQSTAVVKKPAHEVAPEVPKVIDAHPPIYYAGLFYKCDGRRMKTPEMHDILLKVNDPQINELVHQAKTAKGLEYVGYVAIPTFVFGVGYTFYALISNLNASTPANEVAYAPGIISGIVAAGCLATSITFKIKGKQHNKAAIALYNEKY